LKKANNAIFKQPNHDEESSLYAEGYRRIAGFDEAGRGALAGPVVAAAVILPREPGFNWIPLVKDSKLLTGKARERIFGLMRDSGIEIGIGIVPPQIIDSINILNATKKAMLSALQALAHPPDYLLIDALVLPGLRIRQKGIVRGDRTVLSIACASIAAKVTRDHIMLELDADYPQYGFCSHKGYGTARHLDCLRRHGACEAHRLTFAPVRDLARLI
jgi:ribonuclease HII